MDQGGKYNPKRLAYLSAGMAFLVLGFIGAFLPLLPTTIFLILASWCFARSSPRLNNWLLSHKTFGPLIKDWNNHGVIRPKAKGLAVLSMFIIVLISIIFKAPRFVIWTQGIIMGLVAAFILTRPSRPLQ